MPPSALASSPRFRTTGVTEDHAEGDFILCAGDDRTDMDMYRRLPDDSLICHVGTMVPGAHYVVDTPGAFRELLGALLSEESSSLSRS